MPPTGFFHSHLRAAGVGLAGALALLLAGCASFRAPQVAVVPSPPPALAPAGSLAEWPADDECLQWVLSERERLAAPDARKFDAAREALGRQAALRDVQCDAAAARARVCRRNARGADDVAFRHLGGGRRRD
jgi:hypothetical protein